MAVILIVLIIAGVFAFLWGCTEFLAHLEYPEYYKNEKSKNRNDEVK